MEILAGLYTLCQANIVYYYKLATCPQFRNVNAFLYLHYYRQMTHLKAVVIYLKLIELRARCIVPLTGVLEIPYIGVEKDNKLIGSFSLCQCCTFPGFTDVTT